MPNDSAVKFSPDSPVADMMRAWVLCDPNELTLKEKPVPKPGRAEILARIDAVAICATDLEIIHHGTPAQWRRIVGIGHDPGVEDFTTWQPQEKSQL